MLFLPFSIAFIAADKPRKNRICVFCRQIYKKEWQSKKTEALKGTSFIHHRRLIIEIRFINHNNSVIMKNCTVISENRTVIYENNTAIILNSLRFVQKKLIVGVFLRLSAEK